MVELAGAVRSSGAFAFAAGARGGTGVGATKRYALVLEDDAALATTIADALTEAGWQVRTVHTIVEARALIEREHPALLVLDLTLSDEFGGELLEHLAGRDDAPATVIVSGFGLAPIIAARFDVELVRKPFDVDRLLTAVERAEREGVRPRTND